MIRFNVLPKPAINFSVKSEENRITVEKASVVYMGGEPYDGEYEVIPRLTQQILETKDKLLEQDLVIEKIPITSVSNQSGGNTIIIG